MRRRAPFPDTPSRFESRRLDAEDPERDAPDHGGRRRAAAGVPTQAAEPEVEIHIDDGIVVLDGPPCGGFIVEEETISERVRFTTFLNEAGEPVMRTLEPRRPPLVP